MAYHNSPRIITDGLKFCVDVPNLKSYPNAGTIWFDMVQNLPGSMTGITYASANTTFLFNGSNSTINYGTNFLGTNNFTIMFWCKPNATRNSTSEANSGITGTSGQRYVTEAYNTGDSNAGVGVSVGTNGVSVFEHAPFHMPSPLVWDSTVSSTSFTHVTIAYTSKQPTLYVNGYLARTGLTSARSNVYPILGRLGDSGASYGLYSGELANLYIYNRTLTADEIRHNYNTLKGRFGLV